MKRLLLGFLLLSGLHAAPLAAQDAAAQEAAAKEAAAKAVAAKEAAAKQREAQAARLESELTKYKDTAPEAADLMVQLIDLYHADGQLFSLVRVGQQFVALHAQDPRHQAAMLKLLDGLEALSRHKEMVAASRQFIARYPQSLERPLVVRRLGSSLSAIGDFQGIFDAYVAEWRRQPNADSRDFAVGAASQAIHRVNSNENRLAAAKLLEELFDAMPAGEYAVQIGNQAVQQYRSLGRWSEAVVLGNKMLKKGLPLGTPRQQQVHQQLSEGYANLGQHANAIDHLVKARQLGDRPDLHLAQIYRMQASGAKPEEIGPLAKQYVEAYKDRDDRHRAQALFALAVAQHGDRLRAAAVAAPTLFATGHQDNLAQSYVGWVLDELRGQRENLANNLNGLQNQLDNVTKDHAAKEAAAKEAAAKLPPIEQKVAAAKAALEKDAQNAGLQQALQAAQNELNNAQNQSKAAADALAGAAAALADAKAKHAEAAAALAEVDQKLADAYAANEKVFLEAIEKAQGDVRAHLAHTLAFSVQRDRQRDYAKMFATLRQLLKDSASDSDYYWHAIQQLLSYQELNDQFKADVALLLQRRKDAIYYGRYRNWLNEWSKNTRNDKQQAEKAKYVMEQLAQADRDPAVACYIANASPEMWKAALAPDSLKTLNLGVALNIASNLGSNYYHQGRDWKSYAAMFEQLQARYPDAYHPVARLLAGAILFEQWEVAKTLAPKVLALTPVSDPDAHRGLLGTAEATKDAELGKAAYAWIMKAGVRPESAEANCDSLARLGLLAESNAFALAVIDKYADRYEAMNCADRLVGRLSDEEYQKVLPTLLARWPELTTRRELAHANHALYVTKDLAAFEKHARAAIEQLQQFPLVSRNWHDYASSWRNQAQHATDYTPEQRRQVFAVVRDMRWGDESNVADMELLALPEATPRPPIDRLLTLARVARGTPNDQHHWNLWMSYAQAAVRRKAYTEAATLLTGMLTAITQIDEKSRTAGQDMIAQAYSRLGTVGMTIDENSPIAPLLRAVLYLRLGDKRLAFDTYAANKELFQEHRAMLPPEFIIFICEQLVAAGGEENLEYVEDVLRSWLVKNSEADAIAAETKAEVQLLLAKTFFKAQRYEIARSEYTTVINRYAATPQALEAKFGIGETFMAQKVYDQAEQIFQDLAAGQAIEIVTRAEFLRGVLAMRRGDSDEARQIFQTVLERVPSVELANQTLFSLSEIYGAEQRYLDQLNLLRTVGRLGQSSKRQHEPGEALSIVVHDSDLGISRGHHRIPVRVTTEPGGDEELVYLTSSGGGKGLFRVDLDTALGAAVKGDKILQVTGKDVIRSDYPEEFKKEFRNVPLSDVEIQIASDAAFEVASSQIVDAEKESFSDRLARETREREAADKRMSQGRPAGQIKPGNPVYLRVKDADRDVSDEADTVLVKLVASSGDQVQAKLTETGPHTGVFVGTVATGELPAGALASDTSINHSPLMAIDQDEKTYWVSEPDGGAPKTLTIDMKRLVDVAEVEFSIPTTETGKPVRAHLLGSYDGEFWFRLGGLPGLPSAPALSPEPQAMEMRAYAGRRTDVKNWSEVVTLWQKGKLLAQEPAAGPLEWVRPQGENPDRRHEYSVIWHGQYVHPRSGAVRFALEGDNVALAIDGALHIAPGGKNRSVDVWLTAGPHTISAFAARSRGEVAVKFQRVRASLNAEKVLLQPFEAEDFDAERKIVADEAPETPVASTIALTLDSIRLHQDQNEFKIHTRENIPRVGFWHSLKDHVDWEFEAPAAGAYDVVLSYAHDTGGSKFQIEFENQKLPGVIANTGGWDKFRDEQVGTIVVPAPGKYTLAVKALERAGAGVMDVAGITLRPSTGGRVVVADDAWKFHCEPQPVRYVRFVVDEYLGESVGVKHVKIVDADEKQVIPTEVDVLSLSTNDALEIAGGDRLDASYTDEVNRGTTGASRLLTGKLSATYFNGVVNTIAYDFLRDGGGAVRTQRKDLLRIDPGERIIVEVTDYDRDTTAERDQAPITVSVNGGEPLEFMAIETQPFSGVFTQEIDTSAKPEKGKLVVQPGDQVICRYQDVENTFPGHAVPREMIALVNEPTEAKLVVLETRITPPPAGSKAAPQVKYVAPADPAAISGVALAAPMTIEVVDPDAAKDGDSEVTVQIETTEGARLDVQCVLPDREALKEGRFTGQVIMQLGGKDSPELVAVTADMPRKLTGGPKMESDGSFEDSLVARVLNLTGKDIAKIIYVDALRPDKKSANLTAQARLITNGALACTDRDYEKPVTQLHVGERLYLQVIDPDHDASEERDLVNLEITTASGEKETVTLEETLVHSGVFTGSVLLAAAESPTVGNVNPVDPAIETYFGDTIKVRYLDESANNEEGKLDLAIELPVVVGTDGLVTAFTKIFNDEQLAVETKFHIAESYFELFKSHKDLGRSDDQKSDLQAGKRVLREVMEDYPDPKYAPRVAYLLGQFAQELEQWDEAIESYRIIIRQYGDHTLAPDAQYKLAQCYEESGDFDEALEAYVTLAATYPQSPLIASVMIRISDYFYKQETFDVAGEVGQKFLEKFASHQHAPRMAFRVGQCFYKAEKFVEAGKAFDGFVKQFPEDALCADALFWSGESYRMGKSASLAFQRYNRCRWDYPSSDAAKYARGRLALPEMLDQFEKEASSLDQ